MKRLWRAYVRAAELKERALRAFMPARMRFVHYSWPLRPEICPCDVHFCAYLKQRNVRRKSIFHFGTGGHHLVGRENRDAGLENEILAITASPAEHARYVSGVIREPSLGRHYKVLFGDIYDLSPAGLPTFDLVTLFHLCEFSLPPAAGKRLDDAGLLDLFLARLAPGGKVILYARSGGHARAEAIVGRAVAAGRLSHVEDYESLLVYQR